MEMFGVQEWPMQDAKNRLSELVKRASKEGPQTITVHGKASAVIVSFEDFQRWQKPTGTLADFFLSSPLAGMNLEIERAKDTVREVEF